MYIEARIKASSKRNSITPCPDSTLGKVFNIALKSPAQDGKANQELIKVLSKHFKIPQRNITIKRGATSSRKLIELTSSEIKYQ
jgi:uncharacterized protein (TIGR00251 family)